MLLVNPGLPRKLMPKFDSKAWKEMCPDSAEGSPLPAAIKEWNIHCPEEYDDPTTDPRKLVNVATATCKKFVAAIADTEKRITKVRITDRKTKEKIGKVLETLSKWEDDAKHYVTEITKWSQTALREENEERKNLWRAQEHFAAALMGGFEEAMKKLAVPAKEFEAALKARNFAVAAVKFDLHRKLLTEAAYHLRPISIAKIRDQTASKFHVALNLLAIPPQFHALGAKVKKADTLDEDMADRLERAAEAEAEGAAEPDGATSPEYRKAVREVLNAYKGIVVKLKSKVPLASQYLQAATQIKSVPVTDASYQKTVLDCRALNERAFAAKKEVHSLLDQMRNANGALRKKVDAAKVTEADYKRTLQPQVNAALAFTRRLVGIDTQAARVLEDWLRAVAKAHPESKDAAVELSHMTSKYHIRLI